VLDEVIVCRRCGQEIKVEREYNIQFCECGVYYRKSRDFTNRWVLGGWWKGEKSKKELERQERKKSKKR
jgi:hypothetical protein